MGNHHHNELIVIIIFRFISVKLLNCRIGVFVSVAKRLLIFQVHDLSSSLLNGRFVTELTKISK